MIGRPVTSWVRFSLGFDLTGPAGRSWLSLVRLLLSELDSEHSLVRESAAHREQLERMVISSLLRAQPHDFFDALHTEGPPMRSRRRERGPRVAGRATAATGHC
jgi:AraC-binding-like domain